MNLKVLAAGALALTICAGAQAKEVTVAGVLYNPGDGYGWRVMVDAAHQPQGIQTAWNDSSAIALIYNFHATVVRSLIVTGDEIYAGRMGIVCGANVGLDYAIIECSKDGVRVDMNTLTKRWGNLFVYGVFDDGL